MRQAPGVGGGSLKHFQEKYHKEMLKRAKSQLKPQFNDRELNKRREKLSKYKKDSGL